MPFFVVPLTCAITIQVTTRFHKLTRRFQSKCLDTISLIISMLVFLLTLLILWLPGPILTNLHEEVDFLEDSLGKYPALLNDLPLVIRFFGLAGLTAFVIGADVPLQWMRERKRAAEARLRKAASLIPARSSLIPARNSRPAAEKAQILESE
eukprot:TRINITY_DN23924_c0_g1_i6.p1 TRINITY_DN23924_c0_g1~~TRINITY_DN23924_c0_g1_i6.p1  ORF type:complete len:152 (-),score=8.73 TRINITY_DN23924_c0_g1_i6:224-679(-)